MCLQTSLNPPPLLQGWLQAWTKWRIALYLMSVLVTLSDRWHQAEQQALNADSGGPKRQDQGGCHWAGKG